MLVLSECLTAIHKLRSVMMGDVEIRYLRLIPISAEHIERIGRSRSQPDAPEAPPGPRGRHFPS